MPSRTTTEETKALPPDEAGRRRLAYSAAEKALREEHRAEFEKIYEYQCRQFGVPYKRKLTAAEKEEKQLREILERRPDLMLVAEELVTEYHEAAQQEADSIRAAADVGEEV